MLKNKVDVLYIKIGFTDLLCYNFIVNSASDCLVNFFKLKTVFILNPMSAHSLNYSLIKDLKQKTLMHISDS